MYAARIVRALLCVSATVAFASSSARGLPVFTVAGTGTAANINNYPAAEKPAFAIDGTPSTKYLNFAKLNTGYLVTHTAGGTVTGITFATANDAPERDPLTFSLYGSNTTSVTGTEAAGTNIDLASFTPITLTQAIPGFATDPGRNTLVASVPIVNTTNYASYLLVFPTVRNPATANSMQIGDAVLTGASGNITAASDPILGGVFAVPEPATITLFAFGALALARRRRD